MKWSRYQQACIDDARDGSGHTVVVARAGSGKSTVQEEMICHVERGSRVLVSAFSVDIRKAFGQRAERIATRRPDLNRRNLEIKTVSSLGFAVCRYNLKTVKVDEYKAYDLFNAMVPDAEIEYRSMVVQLGGLAKGALAHDMRAIVPICNRNDAIDAALSQCGIDPQKATEEQENAALRMMGKHVLALLNASKNDTSRIDLDDMWWFPVVLGMRGWGYDRIFCDEAQDLSYCQFKLLRKMIGRNGRMCFVGDPMQVIYQWRGGRTTMLDLIAEETKAKTLSLSITYRCDRAIVDLAQEIVPDFEARPGAPEGALETVCSPEYEAVYNLARPGDFVISRKNAPLLTLCLGFLKRGVPAIIRGRGDVAAMLLRLIDKSKMTSIERLIQWTDGWQQREIIRATRKDPGADTSSITDTAEAIRVLSDEMETVSALRYRIESLFIDGDDARRVVLTSTHRAKGLERDRCIVLADTFRRGGEESRLWYVAVTRAKHELFLVYNQAPPDETA